MTAAMSYRLLGPIEVERDGVPLLPLPQRQLACLGVLLLEARRVIPVADLVRALWGEDPPDRATATLHVHISKLRKAIGDGTPTVVTRPPGYLVDAGADELDVARFTALVAEGRTLHRKGALAEAIDRLSAAEQLWRGEALADLQDVPFVDAARVSLTESLLSAREERLEILLLLNQHREAVGELEAFARDHPLRETVWELLMLALYRCNRQADALAAFGRARRILDDELGIAPGARLRELEMQILNQDPKLAVAERSASWGGEVELDVTTTAPTVARAVITVDDGRTYELGARITIGRSPDCGITLVDPMVSRRHAEIRPVMGRYLLLDSSSANGTWLGADSVSSHLLAHGDEFRLGERVLRYEELPASSDEAHDDEQDIAQP